jgi:MFS family permease
LTTTNIEPGGSAPQPPIPSAASPKTSLKKVAAASSIGTTIEWYDFFIYGTAAALVFPTLFFPGQDASAATLSSFATFAVAFFARPVGAAIFGHFGDRIGRKRTLVWTLMIMGIATVFIGLLPGYGTGAFGMFEGGIGIWAPTLLVVCRFFQGFAVGGEWAGATLLTAEYAPEGKRGMMAMWPQLGVAFAFFLSSGTFLAFSLVAGDSSAADSSFMQYGWRIPFLLSAVLVLIGLWIRISVEETPVFKQDRERAAKDTAPTTLPFADAIRYQWKEILIAGGALTSLFSLFYMGTSFLTNYATKNLEHTRPFVLGMGMIAALVFGAAIALSAMYSDRIGRKKVIGTSVGLAVVWALFVFPILDTGSPIAFAVVPPGDPHHLRHRLRPGRRAAARAVPGPLPVHRRRSRLQPRRHPRRRAAAAGRRRRDGRQREHARSGHHALAAVGDVDDVRAHHDGVEQERHPRRRRGGRGPDPRHRGPVTAD